MWWLAMMAAGFSTGFTSSLMAAEVLLVCNEICARAPDFHQDKDGSSHGQWGETGCPCCESHARVTGGSGTR